MFRGSAGFRQAIGEAKIPDLSLGNGHNSSSGLHAAPQGAYINPEMPNCSARIGRPSRRGEDFPNHTGLFWPPHPFLGLVHDKFVDVQRRALGIAEERLSVRQSQAGALAPLDVVEATRSPARAKSPFLPNDRGTSNRMSMFLWENQTPTGRKSPGHQIFLPRLPSRRRRSSKRTSCKLNRSPGNSRS